jgi:predicted SAM-dependent methyltransferase
MLRLNVGAGKTPLDGYVSVDKYVGDGVKADMGDLPYPDGAVDAIFCAHALEHVPFGDTDGVLAEFLRVLRPGGELTVVVPNMEWVAGVWSHDGDRRYALQVAFGNQDHEGEFHKTGWKPLWLYGDLQGAGFEVRRVMTLFTPEYSQESIIADAVKPSEESASVVG